MPQVNRIRTGARTFLDIMVRACKLSHMPGFVTGLQRILGDDKANQFYLLWTPLCAVIEGFVAVDDVFNQVDHDPQDDGDEDVAPLL